MDSHKTSQNLSINNTVAQLVLKLVTNLVSLQDQSPKETLLAKLLINIDSQFFESRLLPHPITFKHLLDTICDYYIEKREQRVARKFYEKRNYCDRFLHTFQLVFDLVLTASEAERERYLEQILKMSEQQRRILNQFCYGIENRSFIQKIKDISEDIDQMKNEQYSRLLKEYEEIKQKYLTISQVYEQLKIQNENLINQYTDLMSEKQQCCYQLGIHKNSPIHSIAEKYCHDVESFKSDYKQLQKQLLQRNTLLHHKQQQLEAIRNFYKSDQAAIRGQSEKQQIDKFRAIQEIIVRKEEENAKIKEEVKKREKLVEQLCLEIEKKQEIIEKLKVDRQKLLQAKAVHSMFAEKFKQFNFPAPQYGFEI